MTLAPEALAFLGRPPASSTLAAKPVAGYAGKQCEQPNQHTKDPDMPKPKKTPRRNGPPTDLYDRIKAAITDAGKPLGRKEIVAYLGDPEATIAAALKKMADRGMLAPSGQSRNRVYRVAKAAKKAPAPSAAARKAKRLVMQYVPGPRFGVFEDGSVEVRLPDCRGTISGDDAAALHAFITKLRG